MVAIPRFSNKSEGDSSSCAILFYNFNHRKKFSSLNFLSVKYDYIIKSTGIYRHS